jgi:hypothetical protein
MAGLARHVDTDGLLKILHDRPLHQAATKADGSVFNATSFSSRYSSGTELSKFRIPHEGVDAGVAYQLLKDELDLDGVIIPHQNQSHAKNALEAELEPRFFRINIHGTRGR